MQHWFWRLHSQHEWRRGMECHSCVALHHPFHLWTNLPASLVCIIQLNLAPTPEHQRQGDFESSFLLPTFSTIVSSPPSSLHVFFCFAIYCFIQIAIGKIGRGQRHETSRNKETRKFGKFSFSLCCPSGM